MRAYCEEAQKFGDQVCPQGAVPRHVTVILNPRTKGSKHLYEDYAAPLLHLAGLKVSVFRTEHPGQAKDLMKIMDNTDAVIVAGGDGTLSEAVTGLLNRTDRLEASERFPMGFVPLGKTNTLVRRLFYREGMREQELAAEAALAVVRGMRARIDAYRVDFHEEKLWTREEDDHGKRLLQLCQKDLEAQGLISFDDADDVSEQQTPETAEQPKDLVTAEQAAEENDGQQPSAEKLDPIFGIGKVEYGIFRDIDANIDRYWYFGPLRARAAYLFQSLRRKPIPEETEIRISNVCSGCSRCLMRDLETVNEVVEEKQVASSPGGTRWWSSYVKKTPPPKKASTNPFEAYKSVENDDCGAMQDTAICYTNLEVEPDQGGLVVRASPATLSSTEVLVDGMRRHRKYVTPCITEQLRVGGVQFDFPQKKPVDPSYIPTPEEEKNRELRLKGAKINIDSEVFARQPISVTLYPKSVNVFVAKT